MLLNMANHRINSTRVDLKSRAFPPPSQLFVAIMLLSLCSTNCLMDRSHATCNLSTVQNCISACPNESMNEVLITLVLHMVYNIVFNIYLAIMEDEGLEISQPGLDSNKSEVHHRITADPDLDIGGVPMGGNDGSSVLKSCMALCMVHDPNKHTDWRDYKLQLLPGTVAKSSKLSLLYLWSFDILEAIYVLDCF
eukprot:Gb_09527 [translate_table: standard]